MQINEQSHTSFGSSTDGKKNRLYKMIRYDLFKCQPVGFV